MAPAVAVAFTAALQERAHKTTTEVVERLLTGRGFNAGEVPDWCDEIGGQAVAALAAEHEGYRFTATVTIMQRGKGAGISVASAAAFDAQTDGAFTVKWENASLLCVVSVFALAS